MNIPLPDSMRAYVDQRISQGGYGTSNEYVRELMRRIFKVCASAWSNDRKREPLVSIDQAL